MQREEDVIYHLDCIVCDMEFTIIVHEIDEKPNFCPMCGEEFLE